MPKQLNRLKELRQEKGISLNKLSEVLKENYNISVSASQLMYYEKGEREPRNKEIWDKLADFFNVSVGYLLGYEELLNQIEKLESDFSTGVSMSQEMSSKASSNYENFLKDILDLLAELKKTAEVTQIDSDVLIENIELLERNIDFLNVAVKQMLNSQKKQNEIQSLSERLKLVKQFTDIE